MLPPPRAHIKIKGLITFLFTFLVFSVSSQVYLPDPPYDSPNNNVGINEPNPQARLHISDDSESANCVPAILVDGNYNFLENEDPVINDPMGP